MHPCIDVVAVKYVHDILKSIWNRNHTNTGWKKHPMFLNESDHDYILEEIEHRDKIDLERNLSDAGNEE